MRILVSEFHQESNSFSPQPSDLEFWLNGQRVLDADDVRDALAGKPCAMGGIIDVLEGSPLHPQVFYAYSMFCRSGGTARQEVLDHYTERLLKSVADAMPLDGVFFSFHGAMQTDEFDDAEAEVVRRVREVVGQECVIAASTDLHGYISTDLVERVDVICGYQSYPHVDFYETGARAARLGLQAIAGQHQIAGHQQPVMAWAAVPMMVSASAYNSHGGAFGELLDDGRRRVAEGELLDFTIYQMQPWLDVAQPHSTVLAVASTEEAAVRHARELAAQLYGRRHAFAPDLQSIDEVVDLAEDPATAKPVILVDSADSGNAGAPGDSMAVADVLLRRSSRLKAATIVNDSAAAARAHELGVGATGSFRIGGSHDPSAVTVEVEAYVRSLHDGAFVQEGPAGRGMVQTIGQTAVLRVGTLDVVVCEWIAGNGDPQLYRAFGVEPTLYDLIVVKANTSFRAGYGAFAGEICETDTPGAASANVYDLPFRRLPKTIYPWVDTDVEEFDVRIARRY